jgi:hypothetical protein
LRFWRIFEEYEDFSKNLNFGDYLKIFEESENFEEQNF